MDFFSLTELRKPFDSLSVPTLDLKEVDLLISERKRCRYLRNISPPYDTKGKWKNKTDNRRRIGRKMKKSSLAAQACSSWLAFCFTVILLLTALSWFSISQSKTATQSAFIRHWFETGFVVNKDLHVCGKSRNVSTTAHGFRKISDFSRWQHWLESVLASIREPNFVENRGQNGRCNVIVLNSVKLVRFVKEHIYSCSTLPTQMQQLLAGTKHCHTGSTRNKSIETTPIISFFDLVSPPNFSKAIVPDLEAIQIEFVVYNQVTRVYSLVKAYTPFINQYRKPALSVGSVSIGAFKDLSPEWLFITNFIILVWIIYYGLSGAVVIIEKGVWWKRNNKETSWRAFKANIVLKMITWLIITGYFISFSIYRRNLRTSLEIFEKSNHLLEDPGSVISTALNNEFCLRMVVGVWIALVLINLLRMVIFYHGFKSKYARAVTAVYYSVTKTGRSCLGPAFLVILTVGLARVSVSYWFYNPTVAYENLPQSMFSFLFSLTGKNKELNTRFAIIGSLCVFVLTRIFLKGYIIASHQWYYRGFKTCTPNRHSLLCNLKKKKTADSREKKEKKARWSILKNKHFKLLMADKSRGATCHHVAFKDMFMESLRICAEFPPFKSMQRYVEPCGTANTTEAGANHLSTLDNASIHSMYLKYDKSKLPDEDLGDLKTDPLLPNPALNKKMSFKRKAEMPEAYALPIDSILTEVRMVFVLLSLIIVKILPFSRNEGTVSNIAS